MVLQDSLLVTLVKLVDRLPLPAQASEGEGVHGCTQVTCS